MSKEKETKNVAVNKSLTESELLEQMGQCTPETILPYSNFHLSKEKFKEIIQRYKTLDDVRKYFLSLEFRSCAFDSLGEKAKKALDEYGKSVQGNNFAFHGAFIDQELGKSVFFSNLSQETITELTALMFRNCQMSPCFRDVIVGTYMLCKKAGIDKGDFTPKM